MPTHTMSESQEELKKARSLIAGLYDVDMEKRFRSATTLGELAGTNPELIRKMWNRIFYAFDDTMSCWGVSEGLGEIARNIPDLRSKILALLRKFQHDEASCQGFVWAVCRIGQVDGKLVADFIPDLVAALDSDAACMLGQTIWGLGELGISQAVHKIACFRDDPRETWLYENDCVRKRTIGDISAEALKKLAG